MNEFVSIFAEKLTDMLEFRNTLGYKRETYLYSLLRFDKYCKEQEYTDANLTGDIVHNWLDFEISNRNIPKKVIAIRQFGNYLRAIGEEAYVLPHRYVPNTQPKPPYIFTDDELTALFVSIDKLSSSKSEPYFSELAPIIFRLIYTCGLRPREGRGILNENVNLDTGEILLVNTKGKKERIVVMSDEMLNLCREYSTKRQIFGGVNPYFFPSANGGELSNDTLYAAFKKAWGSVPTSKNKQNVRVYDLRHRFASACLNRWLDNGENLNVMLPYLQTFMGHNNIEETAYYIHILPENLVKNSSIDWEAFNSIFPEVQI